MTKRQAWAFKGDRAVHYTPGNKGKNVSVIGAIRESGPVAMQSFPSALNSTSFTDYVKNRLAPRLKKDDVLVMDNLRVHYARAAIEAIQARGAHVLFLPPYSPDFNPIEMTWNAMKRRFEKRKTECMSKLRRAIGGAWRSLKNLDFSKMISACGWVDLFQSN